MLRRHSRREEKSYLKYLSKRLRTRTLFKIYLAMNDLASLINMAKTGINACKPVSTSLCLSVCQSVCLPGLSICPFEWKSQSFPVRALTIPKYELTEIFKYGKRFIISYSGRREHVSAIFLFSFDRNCIQKYSE